MGEIRKFKIDKNKKKECRLPGEGIIEIEIKKEESNVAKFALEMVNNEGEAYLQCDYGYIAQVRTKALIQMEEYLQGCQNTASCNQNEEQLKKLSDLKEWSTTQLII